MLAQRLLQKLMVTVLAAIAFAAAVPVKAADSSLWPMDFSNTNACARNSQTPAGKFYLLADGTKVSRIVFQMAKQAGENVAGDVTEAISEYQHVQVQLSKMILSGLMSGTLPVFAEIELQNMQSACAGKTTCTAVDAKIKSLLDQASLAPVTAVPVCTKIKKTIPDQFHNSFIQKQDLEAIAQAYLHTQDYLQDCDSFMTSKASDFDLMLRFDVSANPIFQAGGFRFWDSYRIYLSSAWRTSSILDTVAPQYSRILRSLSVEQEVLLIPEGCQSLSRPECNSDFLTESDLRHFADGDSFGQASKITTSSLVNSIKDKVETDGINTILDNKGEGFSTGSILSGIMHARIEASTELYDALTFVTTLSQMKAPELLVADIERSLQDPSTQQKAMSELDLVCTENLIASDNDMSPLAQELTAQSSLVQNLVRRNAIGLDAERAFSRALDYVGQLSKLCGRWHNAVINDSTPVEVGAFRTWMKKAMTLIPNLPTQDKHVDPSSEGYLKLGDKTLCADAIECARTLVESYVGIYSASIYSKAMSGDRLQAPSLAGDTAAAARCQIYNPFAFEQVRKKQLVTDLASAAASGLMPLPFYLKVNYQVPHAASFKELIENGNVEYDPQMIDKKTLDTLVIDFGWRFGTPCAIVVSQNPALVATPSIYAFSGITGNVCDKEGKSESKADISGVTRGEKEVHATCGVCQISFQQVALKAAISNIRVFGFVARLVDAFGTYFRSAKSDQMPHSEQVNPAYAAEALQKYQGIPDKCVNELTHGLRCMQDMCASYTVAQFEKKTGRHVADAHLVEEDNVTGNGKQQYVQMKMADCDGDIEIPVNCQPNHKPSFVNLHLAQGSKECRSVR